MKNSKSAMQKCGKIKNESLSEEKAINKHRALDSMAALSGGIAHDYNNILTAIIGNITLARRYLNQGDKAFRLLDQALQASEAARKLTQKLITFSRGGAPPQSGHSR